MSNARQWTRAQALTIGVDGAERSALALLGVLLVLVLLRSITGS